MKSVHVLIFYTLVATSHAAAESLQQLGEDWPQPRQNQKSNIPITDKTNDSDAFHILPMPKPEMAAQDLETEKPASFSRSHSISPHLASLYATREHLAYAIGLQYFNFQSSRPIEYSVDVLDAGSAYLAGAYKWFFFEQQRWQSHAKLGLSLYLNPDQGMASLVDIDNLSALLQYGWEWYIEKPLSLRLDLQALVGQNQSLLGLQIGLAWGY